MEKRWVAIMRGFNGWNAEGINTGGSGGRLLPENGRIGYIEEAQEGALVYDAQHLEYDEVGRAAFIDFVFNGPMLWPALAPDAVERFSGRDRRTAKAMLPRMGGAFATLASAAQDEGFTGLDKVGVAVYERLLRQQVPGVKIGHVHNGRVMWETDSTTGIAGQ